MNIHFYINSSFPYGMAAAKRLLCYARGLMSAGHTVDVVVCQKCFELGENDGLPTMGTYRGVPCVYVCGKYKYAKGNKLMRGVDYLMLDSVRSFFYALRHIHRGDAVFAYYYPIFLQILIIIAAKFKGAKIVKETCEHPSALGNVNSRWHKLCKWFEYHFVMPGYDGFIAISRELSKFVLRYKSRSAECIIVPILVEDPFENIHIDATKSEYDVPYIIHTGTMHEQKDSISKILRAFARFKKETNSACRLVFTGPHANEKCSYLPMIRELGMIDSVDLLGMVSTERVVTLQRHAAMTIIYKSDNLQTRNCFPTKLGEMLICGIPVITTNIGDANLYLENGKTAFIIEQNDEDALVGYIKYILDNPNEAKGIGMAGKNVAEKYFDAMYQGVRLSKFYNSLYNNKNILMSVRAGGIIHKIIKRVLKPEKYARLIGVNIGSDNFIPDKNCWSSEPYLITVGSHCQITSGVRIFTHGGGNAVRKMYPDFDVFGKVTIGDWVYIGTNSLIMPGVTIGDGTLIAAGSVVTKSVPSGMVVGGNPAKIISTIDEYMSHNERFNLNSKRLSSDEKRVLLQSIPDERLIAKKEMTQRCYWTPQFDKGKEV